MTFHSTIGNSTKHNAKNFMRKYGKLCWISYQLKWALFANQMFFRLQAKEKDTHEIP